VLATGCFFAFCDRREKKPQKTLRSGSILANGGDYDQVCYVLENCNALVKRSMCDANGLNAREDRGGDPRVATARDCLLFSNRSDGAVQYKRTVAMTTLCVMFSITVMRS